MQKHFLNSIILMKLKKEGYSVHPPFIQLVVLVI